MKRPKKWLLVGIAYAGFVLLGMAGALLGVAWPSMRGSFGLSLDAVGTLLVTGAAGYLVSSFSSGPLISRFGVGSLLMVSSIVAGVCLLGYSLAPVWWFLVLCGLFVGAGSGTIDAGLNTYFATNHSASLMNWLHACYGLGATLGPIVMTAVISRGLPWRWGYAVAGLSYGLLALCLALTLRQWRLGVPSSPQAAPSSPTGEVRSRDTLRLPVVWFGILLFIMFTGIEIGAGQWPYSLFTEARGVAPTVAGMWVSVYWAALTVGRILLGVVVDRLGVVRTMRVCMLGVMMGCALMWWNVTDLVSFLGLALVGFAEAPLFPSLISDTPRRVGHAHAPNAIGFQVAAAGLGVAVLPGLAGVLAERWGLEIIGPFLFVAAVAMFILHETGASRHA